MTSAYGTKWTTTHGDNFAETSGRIWAIELAGLTGLQVQTGLRQAIRQEWPPTLGDFHAMCRGVLPLATVEIQRAGDPRDQQPFTVLVGRFLPEHEWRMADPQRRERLLAKAHEQAKSHLMAGGALPEYTPAAQQITVEDEQRAPPPIMVTAAEAMAQIRETLNLRPKDDESTVPPPPKQRAPCARCHGSRKDPQHPGECLACYGSGIEAAYNRVVHADGTIQERIP